MKKHLISLVSKQTIPNALFINEAKDVDDYLFIYTDWVEVQLHQIIDAVQLPSNMVSVLKVEPNNLKSIKQELGSQGFLEEDEFVVNITGGTKITVLAAYQFFSQFKNVRLIYLPIGENSFMEIYPENKESKALDYRLDIREYLACHGFKMIRCESGLVRSENYTQQFMAAFMGQVIPKEGYELFGLLRQRQYDHKKIIHPNKVMEDQGLEILKKIDFLSAGQTKINNAEKNYLIGGWLEEYVFSMVQKELGLEAKFLSHSVEISEGQAKNEIDVFFVLNNTAYLIECKTGLNSKAFSPTIYKQSAFRDKLGKDTRHILFSLSDFSDKD
ncbi:MAG: Card1-like endonuclease domain-containing protein, partial [Saprospiraceae bacterium]